MDDPATTQAFELMEQYGDHPMDFANASVIVAAESLRTTEIFTLDLADFRRYRIRRGHRHIKIDILPRPRVARAKRITGCRICAPFCLIREHETRVGI